MGINWIEVTLIFVVGIACGAIGQVTSGYARGGWGVHLSIGVVGAGLGDYLSRVLNAPQIYNLTVQRIEFPIMWSIIGSVFLVAAIGFFVRPIGR